MLSRPNNNTMKKRQLLSKFQRNNTYMKDFYEI